jgi:RNA polymerase sigma-70 factor (ECF subfamily)
MAPEPLTPEAQIELAGRVRTGHPGAEDDLVRLFGARLRTMMLVRIRDREAARELVQEALMAVLLALREGRLREPERLAAFVYGTARNVVNNYHRSEQRRPEEPLGSDLALSRTHDVEAAERLRLVRLALRRVDATDRRILLFTLVRGLKPGEIAREMGLSAEAVRARKSRSLKKVIEYVRELSRLTPEPPHHHKDRWTAGKLIKAISSKGIWSAI